MSYNEPTTISDDILQQAQEAIDDALKNDNLPTLDKIVLEVQNYFLTFLRNDHRKVNEMYPFFVEEKRRREVMKDENKWLRRTVWGAALVAVVMLLINGVIIWISTTPIIQALMKASQP